LLLRLVAVSAIIGSTLIALLPRGSFWNTANANYRPSDLPSEQGKRLCAAGKAKFDSGEYAAARDLFHAAARRATADGSLFKAAQYWTNAGGCSIVLQRFRAADEDF